jgi:photosystem II stability/assembly factor-like uncharacterized protein
MTDHLDEDVRASLEAMAAAGGGSNGTWTSVQDRARSLARRRRTAKSMIVLTAIASVVAVGIALWSRPAGTPVHTISPATDNTEPPVTDSLGPSTSLSANPSGAGRLTAVQMVSTNIGFAVGSTGTILRTDDGGATWRSEAVCGQAAFCGTADLTYLDMVSDTVGFAGGPAVALQTTDGQHWFEYTNEPLTHVHFTSPAEGWGVSRPAENGPAAVVHTTDAGQSWTALPAAGQPETVCFSAPDDGWYAGAGRVYRATSNGGGSWIESLRLPIEVFPDEPGLEITTVELQCAAGGAAWVQFTIHNGAGGHIPYLLYSTQDGGTTWHLVFNNAFFFNHTLPAPDGPGAEPGPFSVIDALTAYTTGNTPSGLGVKGVLVTNGADLGPSQTVAADPNFVAGGASFTNPADGWIIGEQSGNGAIYATTDGGITWTRQL